MLAATLAVGTIFCRAFMFLTPDSTGTLRAVIAAPFFIGSDRLKRPSAQFAC
jgi:hypothetical protein